MEQHLEEVPHKVQIKDNQGHVLPAAVFYKGPKPFFHVNTDEILRLYGLEDGVVVKFTARILSPFMLILRKMTMRTMKMTMMGQMRALLCGMQ